MPKYIGSLDIGHMEIFMKNTNIRSPRSGMKRVAVGDAFFKVGQLLSFEATGLLFARMGWMTRNEVWDTTVKDVPRDWRWRL